MKKLLLFIAILLFIVIYIQYEEYECSKANNDKQIVNCIYRPFQSNLTKLNYLRSHINYLREEGLTIYIGMTKIVTPGLEKENLENDKVLIKKQVEECKFLSYTCLSSYIDLFDVNGKKQQILYEQYLSNKNICSEMLASLMYIELSNDKKLENKYKEKMQNCEWYNN